MPSALALLPLYSPVSRLIPHHQPLRKCIACVDEAIHCLVGPTSFWLFTPHTREKLYFAAICGMNTGNRYPYPPFPFPPITPIRAPALRTQTVPMLAP